MTSLENSDEILSTDRNSYVLMEINKAGYRVGSQRKIIEASPLSPSIFAWKARLMALTKHLYLYCKKPSSMMFVPGSLELLP